MVKSSLALRGESAITAANRAGLNRDAIRGVLRGASPSIDRAADIANALDFEFYIGPPRTPDNLNESPVHSEKHSTILTFSDVELPVNGRAACGLDAQKHRRHREKAEDDLPEPVGLTDDADAFYVVADGSSMVPEGIHPGDYCVVSPNTPLAVGQRLWMEDANGARRIKRLMGFSDSELTLRGWGEPGGGAVGSVDERLQREFLVRTGAVVGVLRDQPEPGAEAELAPDPRAWEWAGPGPARPAPAASAPPAPASTQAEPDWVDDLKREFAVQREELAAVVRAELQARNDLVDDDALAGADPDAAARPLDVVELAAAVGDGAVELDETVTGHLWFRRDWLSQHAIDPAQCAVIGVAGESMEPLLPDGCSILVDRSRRRRLSGRVYVLRTDDGLVVRRLVRDGRDGDWLLESEHPSWETRAWDRDNVIIGEVRWMARSL